MKCLRYLPVFIFTFVFISGCGILDSNKKQPIAKQGILDLRGWNFQKHGPVKLQGQWEFYWKQLLQREDFRGESTPAQTGLRTLPGVWNNYEGPGENLPGRGYATYRLRIYMDPTQVPLALHIQDVGTAYILYANGKILSFNGRVAKSQELMVPQHRPRLVSLQKPGESVELLWHISNFHDRWGGPWGAIELGAKAQLEQSRVVTLFLTLFVLGSLVIMGLYHFGIFLMRRKDQAPLYFSIFCLLIALRSMITGERFLVRAFPAFSWELDVKFAYFTLYMSIPFFASFIAAVFPGIIHKRILYVFWGGPILLSLIVVCTPVMIFSYTLQPFQLLTILFLLYMLYVILLSLIRKKQGAAIFLVSFLFLGFSGINDILFNNNLIQTGYLFPYGLFFFVFLQAFLLSTRSSAAFAAVEGLTGELEGLSNISRRVSEAGDLSDLLLILQDELVEHLGPLAVWLLLVDRRQGALYTESYRPAPGERVTRDLEELVAGFRVPLKPESGTFFRTYQKRRPLLVNRVTEFQKSAIDRTMLDVLGMRAFAELPLIVHNEVIGILAISGVTSIPRRNLRWLKLFADQTAGAVHSATLLARTEQARAETHELNEFSKKLNVTTDLKEHLEHICVYVRKNYQADSIIILRVNLLEKALTHQYDLVPLNLQEIARSIRVPLNEEGGLMYRVYRRKKPFFVSKAMLDRDLFRKHYPGNETDRRLVEDLRLKSFILVPLIVQDQVIGLAMFSSYELESGLLPQDIPAIIKFCEQITGGLYTSSLLDSVRDKRLAADLARTEAEVATREIEQLNRFSRSVNESTDIDAMLEDVFAYFQKTFKIDGCALYLHDSEAKELYMFKFSASFQGRESDEKHRRLQRFQLEPGVGTLYFTFHRRKPFYLKSAQRQLGRGRGGEIDRLVLECWGVNHALQIPLVIQNQSIGILCLARIEESKHLKPEELRSIKRTCEQIAGAIHSSLLFKQVGEQSHALARANEKLQAADRAKTAFFANISHEFRTPLTLILAPVESIIKGDYGQTISKANGIFKSVLQNSLGLLRLINNLLDFTKIEAGRMSARRRKTELVKLLDYYKANVQSGAEAQGLKIHFKHEVEELFAYVDRDLMEKAVLNLLSNSIKFTPAGGEILLQLEAIGEERFRISVKDNGIGIPESKLETIFERFAQADESASRKFEGTGIGLSLTKEIVELHGGLIRAENNHDQGAVFIMELPLSKPEQADEAFEDEQDYGQIKPYLLADLNELPGPESATISQEAAKNHEHQILMVEDNADMRSFLRTLLEKEYRVQAAVNGKEGLRKALELTPDLILSDVMMPEMDGYQMTHEIKRNPDTRDIPVVLLSAKADVVNRIEGLEFGADDFLSKPFNSEELMARIRNQIESRKLEHELKKEKKDRDKDFLKAALVQENILTPRSNIDQIEELEIELTYLPMNGQISGDYYNISPLESGIASVFLADATGHGTQAALSTMQIDVLYREHFDLKNPGNVFKRLNKKFVSELRSKNFFTGIIVDIHPGEIRYSTAGHPEQYLLKPVSKEIRMLRTRGGMIGMRENQNYDTEEAEIEAGDIILLFSDGVYEVFNKQREEFGEERFLELIQDFLDKDAFNEPLRQVLDSILGKLDEFREQVPFRDDITLIAVRIK